MELTIKSRKTGEEFTFWMNSNGGYVYRTFPGREGCLGAQLTENGGSTVRASDEQSFKASCRKWYRNHMKAMEEYV